MKVYIATSGSYSDYRIDNVFLREEDAKAYAQGKGDEGGWDEYEVHEGPVERRPWYCLTWCPHLEDRKGGSGVVANPFMTDYVQDYDPALKLCHEWGKTWNYDPELRHDVLKVEGWDKQDVLKVYSEQRAQYRARKEGISWPRQSITRRPSG